MQLLKRYGATMSNLFIFADYCEAKALINTGFSRRSYNFFSSKQADLVILDCWGSQGVLTTLTKVFSSYSLWINAGFAGAASYTLHLGQCYSVHTVYPYHRRSLYQLQPYAFLPAKELTSFDIPYTDGIHNIFELIDMEGFAIAKLAESYHIPCTMIKIVSDYTEPSGREYLLRYKDKLSHTLASACLKALALSAGSKSNTYSRMPPVRSQCQHHNTKKHGANPRDHECDSSTSDGN